MNTAAQVIAGYDFVLDNDGNRLQADETTPLTMNEAASDTLFGYNTQGDRLLTAGANNFTYDSEGQLYSGYGESYSFDYEHRLTGIGSADQFYYDGAGNRLTAARNGVTTKYIYDLKGNLIAQADGNNNITAYYVYGAGLLETITPDGQAYCYHFDATGNTAALTDQNQNVVNAYTYDPFGNITNQQQEAVAQPFKFAGEWILGQLYRIYESGKQGFDSMMLRLGKMMAETIMYIEREEISGPDYMPFSTDIRKHASQGGSVFIGDQRIKGVQHPRLRGPRGGDCAPELSKDERSWGIFRGTVGESA